MRPLIAAIAMLAFLAIAPRAEAVLVTMTSSGLLVDAVAEGNRQEEMSVVVAARTPEGGISRWKIHAVGCIPGTGSSCMDPQGPDCRHPVSGESGFGGTFGGIVYCERRVPGVTVRNGGGNDQVLLSTGADPVSIDLGDGSDTLRNRLSIGLPFSTGRWTVNAGNGNDRVEGSSGGNVISGGPGDDSIRAFPIDQNTDPFSDRPEFSGADRIDAGLGNDYIDAGHGEDNVIGGGGNDFFRAGDERDRGPDVYQGGFGFDRIEYSSRTSNLFFNSGSEQSGSLLEPKEVDRITGVEHAVLGAGNDTALSLIETMDRRRYDGLDGNDTLSGEESSDYLDGGLGVDRLTGFGGDDTLIARDGIADASISCGAGVDFADLDLKDPNPVKPELCETIERRAVKEASVVRIVSARTAGTRLLVGLRCPRSNDRRCSGRLDAGGRARSYKIRRGDGKTVELLAGPAARRGRLVTLRSVESGRFGDKTVIRRMTPRRRR